ncbi:MAG: hypothetical protein ACYC0X_12495 [Pirellulaceae bacterium]
MKSLKDAVEVEAQDARMSPNPPTSAIPYPRWRIFGLVVVHLIVGWIGAYLVYSAGRGPTLWAGSFLGLMLSQASLLGIWGSLGTSLWWRRLIGVVIGIGYLAPVLGIGIYEVSMGTFIVVVVVTLFVAIPLLIVRVFRTVIRLDDSPVASFGRIQFSIRHLMILTFVVACLVSLGKLVQPFLFHGRVIDLFLEAVTLAFVSILPVWFVLATKWPIIFSIGLVAVGACVGYCIGQRFGDIEELMTTATATEALSVVVSLLVVRSGGYRLVRLPR